MFVKPHISKHFITLKKLLNSLYTNCKNEALKFHKAIITVSMTKTDPGKLKTKLHLWFWSRKCHISL